MARSSLNLEKMTLPELRELIDTAKAELGHREHEEKQKTIQQLRQLARDAGISQDELAVLFKSGPGKAKVKYRNPENPKETWSGRGKRPRWLVEKLDSGMTLDQFSVA